jgi:hypothetical protein
MFSRKWIEKVLVLLGLARKTVNIKTITTKKKVQIKRVFSKKCTVSRETV